MFVYRCPVCKSSLPRRDLLFMGDTTCPGCNREIEPRRWTVNVTILTMLLFPQLLQEFVFTEMSGLWRFLLSTVIALASVLTLRALTGPYLLRVKTSRTSMLSLDK